jgi:hypothetical protein
MYRIRVVSDPSRIFFCRSCAHAPCVYPLLDARHASRRCGVPRVEQMVTERLKGVHRRPHDGEVLEVAAQLLVAKVEAPARHIAPIARLCAADEPFAQLGRRGGDENRVASDLGEIGHRKTPGVLGGGVPTRMHEGGRGQGGQGVRGGHGGGVPQGEHGQDANGGSLGELGGCWEHTTYSSSWGCSVTWNCKGSSVVSVTRSPRL